MKENQFNSEVVKSLRAFGFWSYKIPDSPTSWTMKSTRFTPEKPCDILACFYGRMVAIEGKQMKSWKAFGINQLRPSQIKNLDAIKETRGRAYIFLNVRIATPRTDRLIIFEWGWFRNLPKSIGKKELMELPYISKVTIDDERVYNLAQFKRDVGMGFA